jgi:hypothetical protein
MCPLYEYSDPGTGVKVELRRPVDDRNKPIVLIRDKTVPDRVTVHGLEPSESESFDTGIVKALHRKEEREGSRFKCAEFSKAQLKKVWMESPP